VVLHPAEGTEPSVYVAACVTPVTLTAGAVRSMLIPLTVVDALLSALSSAVPVAD